MVLVSPSASFTPALRTVAPPVAAAPAPASPIAGASAGIAAGGGGHEDGGGGFLSGLLHRIFNPRTLIFAGLGAAAAMYIPPLAFLGGPIGGAIGGALLSMIL